MPDGSTQDEGPNAQQAKYWNDVAGPKWVALAEAINGQIQPIGHAAMERARIERGQRVLDVGCGCGQTSLELAQRVGEQGHVDGLDLSEPMLAEARVRGAELKNLQFTAADVQVHGLEEAAYDRIFSRFGVMFFDDPEAAFANLRGALAPGGQLTFVCWQEIGSNPWMAVPGAAACGNAAANGSPFTRSFCFRRCRANPRNPERSGFRTGRIRIARGTADYRPGDDGCPVGRILTPNGTRWGRHARSRRGPPHPLAGGGGRGHRAL